MDNYSYPIGSDTENAPWNQTSNPQMEIDVAVSITLSKTVKVKVSDYQIAHSGIDEEGNHYTDYDFSECDLKSAVKKQMVLPNEAFNEFKDSIIDTKDKKLFEDLKDWNVDDFEVIME